MRSFNPAAADQAAAYVLQYNNITPSELGRLVYDATVTVDPPDREDYRWKVMRERKTAARRRLLELDGGCRLLQIEETGHGCS